MQAMQAWSRRMLWLASQAAPHAQAATPEAIDTFVADNKIALW
jgi:hypothetical protein